MTLNCCFALKSVFGSAYNDLAYSGFRAKLFGNLQNYAFRPTFSGRNVAQGRNSVSGSIYGLCRFAGIRWRVRVK